MKFFFTTQRKIVNKLMIYITCYEVESIAVYKYQNTYNSSLVHQNFFCGKLLQY